MSTILNEIKERVIEQYAYRKANQGLTVTDLKQLLEEMKTKDSMLTLRPQSGITNALDYNKCLDEIELDLLVLFEFLNTIDQKLNVHQDLQLSSVHTLNSWLDTLEEELSVYEQLLQREKKKERQYINLSLRSPYQENSKLYRERFGEAIYPENVVQLDADEKVIQLNYVSRHNMLTYQEDVKAGYLQLSKQLGGVYSFGTEMAKQLERMIDTSHQTYWADSLFTDEPIQMNFYQLKPEEEGLKDYYYGIQQGALFEIEVIFESISRLNEITLHPYFEYPFEWVAARYKTTDNEEEALIEILSPDQLNPSYQSQTLSQPRSVQFEPINCKRLYLIFNQVHYTKDSFLLNPLDLLKNNLWLGMNQTSSVSQSTKDGIYAPYTQDVMSHRLDLALLQELEKKNPQLSIEKIVASSNQQPRVLSKCHYQYGFYHLAPSFVEFEQTGVYVTQPIQASGNIQSIELEVDEELTGNYPGALSDIEYYVCPSRSENLNDWLPVLPINRLEIKSERLQQEGNTCPLRFHAQMVYEVAKDGVLLTEAVDYRLEKKESEITHIQINNFQASSIYTVRYIPTETAYTASFGVEDLSSVHQTTETLNGNHQSYYELSEYPYLDLITSARIKLINKETGQILSESNGEIKQVTNPLSAETSYLSFDYSSHQLQYYFYQNQLFFNQEIDSTYNIEVSYPHHVSSFYIKAIFRRNHLTSGWVTPKLKRMEVKLNLL